MDVCQDPDSPSAVTVTSTIENQTLIRWTTGGTGQFSGLSFSNDEILFTPPLLLISIMDR